ncbi:MAG: D-alanyl-D-alanine carboxypeptidase family protein [Rhodoferax sp.]|nr:D-alanyl-D-alanine carboxypeptidase family protein [Rhodoferax sp.]
MQATVDFAARIAGICQELGIAAGVIAQRGLQLQVEPAGLVEVCVAADGHVFQLTPSAREAWHAMQAAAARDGVAMALVSAYRSVERQREIVATKLARGETIANILTSVAPPGYSEHHTGRAIDIGTSEEDALEEVFETTPAFAWLQVHAGEHGFVMSYPRDNAQGFVYEPWHWCFRQPGYTGSERH